MGETPMPLDFCRMTPPDLIYILFLFIFGACIGSFLNVVVWRLPRAVHPEGATLLQSLFTSARSISHPPSHCPRCEHPLAWRDNLPVVGWILLGGKCRYCQAPISPKYPIFEAITGLLFVFYYICFFQLGLGPCSITRGAQDEFGRLIPATMQISTDWPIFLLYLFVLASLLAASLIDAESYTIPLEIPWLMAVVGIIFHAVFDTPALPGALNAQPVHAALAAGAAIGLCISIFLLHRGIFKQSFADGGAPLEIELKQDPALEAKSLSRKELNDEMRKEIIFLFPPLVLGSLFSVLVLISPSVMSVWSNLISANWISGILGAILGALVGGFVVWFVRIAGSIGFGREAMGLGDVHLMFGVGACVGAWIATLGFFFAPFAGIVFALYKLVSNKGRELPYGPFLALGTAAAMLFCCDLAEYVRPGVQGVAWMIRGWFGASL